MTHVWTWVRALLALLILPIVAVGGNFCVCTCHHETVYTGKQCNCHHEHEQHEEQPHQQHQCTHIETEMQPTSGHVSVPVFDKLISSPTEAPGFHFSKKSMHRDVALTLERTELWDPPDARTLPLLI